MIDQYFIERDGLKDFYMQWFNILEIIIVFSSIVYLIFFRLRSYVVVVVDVLDLMLCGYVICNGVEGDMKSCLSLVIMF